MFADKKCSTCNFPEALCICAMFGMRRGQTNQHPYGATSSTSTPHSYWPSIKAHTNDAKKKADEVELEEVKEMLAESKAEIADLKAELRKKQALIEELLSRLVDMESGRNEDCESDD